MTKMTNPRSIWILFAVGLLIAAGTQLLSRFVHLPDSILGGCVGLGIGLEIMALVMMKKLKTRKG